MTGTGIDIDERFEKEINYRCKRAKLTRKDFSQIAGFCRDAIDRMIERKRIGFRSFDRLRKLNLEPLEYQVDFKSNEQKTAEETKVSKKTLNRNERPEKISTHIDEEASQLIYDYMDLMPKSAKLTQKEIISALIKTHLPNMIIVWKNNAYGQKTAHELIDLNIEKDRKIEELEKEVEKLKGDQE